jgi:hypothetical protein
MKWPLLAHWHDGPVQPSAQPAHDSTPVADGSSSPVRLWLVAPSAGGDTATSRDSSASVIESPGRRSLKS